jgi:hypothetical protein
MAKRHRHLLSPLQVSKAKAKAKPYRLANGLHLREMTDAHELEQDDR